MTIPSIQAVHCTALGLILVLGAADRGLAAPAPNHRSVKATAADLFGIAEEFVRRGRSDRAESIFVLLAHDPNPDVRNEARYRRSLLLENQGSDRAAAVLLREILDEKPEAAAVRIKLAGLLQKIGDEGSALRELRAVRSGNLPLNVARLVDRLSASLQATKPFGLQVEVAVAPDTNINRATRSDTLDTVIGDFTLDQEAKSGIGAALRGTGQARLQLSDGVNLIGRASGNANLYRDKDFNDITADLAIGPEFRLGRTRLGLEAGLTQQWFGMKTYQRNVRISGSALRPVDAVSQVRLDLSARWADNKLNDLQDGHGLSARARYERALSPQMLVAVIVGADRLRARDDAYSTRSWSAGLTAYRDIGRMTLFAGIDVLRLKADKRLQLFPDAREDRLTRFHMGSVLRQFTFSGFAPMTRLVIERNRSTVGFYDYKRTWTEVGISRAF